MVYGLISLPLRRALSFEAAIVADVLFSAFLLSLVMLKNRREWFRKARSVQPAGPTPASI